MAAADQLLGQIDNLIGMTGTGGPDPASTRIGRSIPVIWLARSCGRFSR